MNRYAEQFMNSRGRLFTFRSLCRQWASVTENEMFVMLGLYLLMGIIQKPTLRSYFSRKRILSTPWFGDIISRDRFEQIKFFLHFADNANKADYEGPAKLYKIFPVLSHLNHKFQNLFLPGPNISIDKSLTLWKGRLSFRQYLPLKAAKFGIKTYELCESGSGELHNTTQYRYSTNLLLRLYFSVMSSWLMPSRHEAMQACKDALHQHFCITFMTIYGHDFEPPPRGPNDVISSCDGQPPP
jgi:hypothetical protein